MSRREAKMPDVLGLIPARGGSKGIPGKNIAPLGGRPLIAYTIEAARRSRLLSDCIVSTDSTEIAEVAEGLGAKVPFIRPPELSTDTARSVEVAIHALDACDPSGRFEYLLLLQPTAPFRAAEDIDGCIELAVRHGSTSVVTFCREESRHPYYMYFIEERGAGSPPRVVQAFDYEVGTPRQDFPPVAFRNGAVYLIRVSHLREARSFVSDDLTPFFMPPERSVDINDGFDLVFAEFLISSGRGPKS